MNSAADEFRKRINELKIWEYEEIKTCLIRLEPGWLVDYAFRPTKWNIIK
jgi:hypothetical protein